MSTVTDNTAAGAPTPAQGLSGVIERSAASHGRAALLLVVFSLIVSLPGFFRIPPVDRDEARFAQASKQMIESGKYVDIRFQNEVRYKKPVGIYWLQVAAVKAGDSLGVPRAHTTIWLYRLPSLVGTVGAVLLTYWAALAFVGRRAALLSALMMAASVMLGGEGWVARTDPMLLLTCVAAMGAMARIYLGERRGGATGGWVQPFILWTAAAGGMLLKGPLILMLIVLTAAALSIVDRSWRWLGALRPFSGFAWMLLLVAPWFVAITAKSGTAFFTDAVGRDMLGKVTGAEEAHGAPPGSYLLLFWLTFWPGSILTALAAPAIWRARREAGTQFLLAWIVPSWIVFELVVTKLPHYVLPLYPAIAILTAGILERGALSQSRWLRRLTAGWFLVPAAIAVAVPAMFLFFNRDLGLIAWPTAAAAAIFGLFAWWLYDVDGAERSLLRAIVASLLVLVTFFGIAIPSVRALFPSVAVARALRGAGCDNPQLAVMDIYKEPSVVFLAGTDTLLTDGAGAAEFLNGGACRFALVDPGSDAAFIQRANALDLRYTLIRKISGYNISKGRSVTLTLFRSAAP